MKTLTLKYVTIDMDLLEEHGLILSVQSFCGGIKCNVSIWMLNMIVCSSFQVMITVLVGGPELSGSSRRSQMSVSSS